MIDCFPAVEHHGASESKISSKGVNNHGPAHIRCLEDVIVDGVVSRVEDDLKENNQKQLKGTGSP